MHKGMIAKPLASEALAIEIKQESEGKQQAGKEQATMTAPVTPSTSIVGRAATHSGTTEVTSVRHFLLLSNLAPSLSPHCTFCSSLEGSNSPLRRQVPH